MGELFKGTYTLMQAMDRMKQPSSFLVDTFFPVVPPTAVTSKIAVEYRKGARKLAPFVIPGTNGVNTSRTGSKIDLYEPPMMGPRRVLSAEELMVRQFGEDVYSTRTPEQRSALRLLVAQLLRRFKDEVRVCGHRDLSPDLNGDGTVEPREWVKQCPCFEVSREL